MEYKTAKVNLYKGFCELKGLRQALGLTQADMAKVLNCTRSGYADIESGRNNNQEVLKQARKFLYKPYRNTKIDLSSLKIMRLRCGLTLHQAIKLLKVGYGTYKDAESGRRENLSLRLRARELFQEIINDLESEI